MQIRRALILGLAFAAVMAPALACSARNAPVTITVQQTPRQTFAGFGTSLTNFDGRFQQLPAATQDSLSQMVWKDLNFKTLRLWFSTEHYFANPAAPDISEFRKDYVDSGIIKLATKYGCTTLLLAPGDVPASFGKSRTATTTQFTDSGVAAYAELIAGFILQLKTQTGVQINATGILNEPNDRPIQFTLAQWPVMIKLLRAALDSRGLTNVAIIAPEAASCDSTAYDMVDSIKSDAAAWASLKGIATHTYNMGATDVMTQKIAGTTKSYWQTESSTPGPEELNNIPNAASSSGRFISDLNHGVTHWIWFIGYEQADPADNGTRILRYDATKPTATPEKLYKYYYLQQLSQAFPLGAVMRPCVSSAEGTMTWTYGTKPSIITAASKNPDGTYSVAIINYTSTLFVSSTLSQWDREQEGRTSQSYTVTVKLDDLAAVSTSTFNVRRSNSRSKNVSAGTVKAYKGVLSITVNPLDLITLNGK